jgi:hypothetical protein
MADLEERTIEQLPDRCQSCGTVLTDGEKATALESGGELVLCKVCAAEQVPLADAEAEEAEDL